MIKNPSCPASLLQQVPNGTHTVNIASWRRHIASVSGSSSDLIAPFGVELLVRPPELFAPQRLYLIGKTTGKDDLECDADARAILHRLLFHLRQIDPLFVSSLAYLRYNRRATIKLHEVTPQNERQLFAVNLLLLRHDRSSIENYARYIMSFGAARQPRSQGEFCHFETDTRCRRRLAQLILMIADLMQRAGKITNTNVLCTHKLFSLYSEEFRLFAHGDTKSRPNDVERDWLVSVAIPLIMEFGILCKGRNAKTREFIVEDLYTGSPIPCEIKPDVYDAMLTIVRDTYENAIP